MLTLIVPRIFLLTDVWFYATLDSDLEEQHEFRRFRLFEAGAKALQVLENLVVMKLQRVRGTALTKFVLVAVP